MRVKQWQSRLAEAVEQARELPFEWGSRDCCLWAATAVERVTGIDPAAAYRGSYSDEGGATALLASLGGLAAVAALVGPEISPLEAAMGDVGLLNVEGADLLAVCIGARWLAVTASGLVDWPFRTATRAWRVGGGDG